MARGCIACSVLILMLITGDTMWLHLYSWPVCDVDKNADHSGNILVICVCNSLFEDSLGLLFSPNLSS